MKNDKAKPLRVVLLDSAGNPEPGEYEVAQQGQAGFRVGTLARVPYWSDEGKTWKRAEESQ